MSFSSCSCFCLLDRTIQICLSCFRAVKMWFFEYNSLILTTGCSTWHLMAKNSLRIWELVLLLSTTMAEAIRSSVTAWNWVTVQWPGSYRGFQRRVSLGTGLARVDQRSWVLVLCVRIQKLASKNRRMSAASIALEVAEVEGQLVSAQTIRHTLQQVETSFRNWAERQFSNIITTPNTPPRWQLPCWWSWRWRWWSGQVCLLTWTLLSTCGASSSGRWRSTMCLTSSSSVMSLWRSGRGCQQQPVQLWWIPCPGGLSSAINGAPTIYWHFGHSFDMFT